MRDRNRSGRAQAQEPLAREVIEMLKKVRQKVVRLFLATAIGLMLLGAPTVIPTYAGDCPIASSSGGC
jgi:hypothetical protein